MGIWEKQVVPRFTDLTLGVRAVRRHREPVVGGASGELVEIGFGSGLNVPIYPASVKRIYAVDPSTVGRRLAAKRLASSPVPVEFVGLDGQEIPLGDESVDAALSTFTLCTIPDAGRALRELYRVLRPGGRFHFLEHGLSPETNVARWQHRMNGIQQRMFGGCNLDRSIDQLVGDAGFEVQDLGHDYLEGPRFARPWGYLYRGVAIKSST